MLASHDGRLRHLYVPNDSAIGRVLAAELEELGYTGPSGTIDEDESDGVSGEPV